MRKIKWGVMGTSFIADVMTIPGMQQAGNCELYAIAGRNMEKAEAFKTKFGFERAYGSYEALLADPEVEAVYIPLPNQMHREWAIKAMQAKKHVLCEKPLAPTESEAKEMIQAAEENGVFLMEAFAYLHSPFTRAIKDEIESGAIGDIRYMENAFITSDYDLSNIRMRKETFGGSTYDLGCYGISQILWMFGEEPKGVQAIAEFSKENIDICTTGMLTFEKRKRAVFQCGMVLATGKDWRIDRLQIQGSKGFISSNTRFNQDGDLSYTVTVGDKTEEKKISVRQNYALEVEQLGRCIAEGEKPYVSNEFTLKVARTMDKVLKAINY